MLENIKITQVDLVTTKVNITPRFNKDWEQWLLLTSDRHWDNPKSDHLMQLRHLEKAKERNALILDAGDFFCAMQGKYDPRKSQEDIRPEHLGDNYLDLLLSTSEKFFTPYAENFLICGMGNHESSILDRCGSNLVDNFVRGLRRNGSKAIAGGFRGWVKLNFSMPNGGKGSSFNIYYTHGGNSNAPVTKGILKAGRRAVMTPDAHIIFSGHIHESWVWEIPRTRLSETGKEYRDEQVHIQLPTYKDEFLGSTMGMHHRKEREIKPLGAWWVRFFWVRKEEKIRFECSRAR